MGATSTSDQPMETAYNDTGVTDSDSAGPSKDGGAASGVPKGRDGTPAGLVAAQIEGEVEC